MSTTEIQDLISKPYNPKRCQSYRVAYTDLFNETVSKCNCNCPTLYNRIKNRLNQGMANNKPNKNISTGKFERKMQVEPSVEVSALEPLDIETVRQELIQGYYYPERVRAAYELISGTDNPANIITMKRTIINYGNSNNT
jgi:hypothetical protein